MISRVMPPDLRIGATLRQQLHDLRGNVIGGSVHSRIAIVIHGVDVSAKVEQAVAFGEERGGERNGKRSLAIAGTPWTATNDLIGVAVWI